MKNESGKSLVVLLLGIFMIVFIIGIGLINKSLLKELEEIEETPVVQENAPIVKKEIVPQKYFQHITKKIKWEPNRRYAINVFSAGDEEIARYKSRGDKNYDFEGNIPDGRVKFEDETRNSHGEEHYQNNKRHGELREYYSNGQLRREASYVNGKLMKRKDYFIDGILYMEQDYTDAMWITENREVGVGKIYNRKGRLKYEWSLTNAQRGGYNRSYNQLGELVDENFFDENGDLIEKEE